MEKLAFFTNWHGVAWCSKINLFYNMAGVAKFFLHRGVAFQNKFFLRRGVAWRDVVKLIFLATRCDVAWQNSIF